MKARSNPLNEVPVVSAICRLCGGGDVEEILDLGSMPLANHYMPFGKEAVTETRYPLALVWCRSCGLLQLRDSVDSDLLFSNYPYASSNSLPSVWHFGAASQTLSERYLSGDTDLVVEIGSNDGVFLRNLVPQYRVLGIDGAVNVCELARNQGIDVICEFLDEEVGIQVRKKFGPAKLIFAANVLAHVGNLQGFMAAIEHLLDNDGVLVVEVPYVANMLRDGSFDQIYHEHACYFSLHNLDSLCRNNSLEMFEVEHISTHGGSLRVHIKKKGNHTYPAQSTVRLMLEREDEIALHHVELYHEFARKAVHLRQSLSEMVREEYNDGRRIIGYGAPAKATTLLNACGIKHPEIECIIDTNRAKVGCQVPGTGIPIVSPKTLRSNPPDLVLILAWNYADYILDVESDLTRKGTRFILPYPRPYIV